MKLYDWKMAPNTRAGADKKAKATLDELISAGRDQRVRGGRAS